MSYVRQIDEQISTASSLADPTCPYCLTTTLDTKAENVGYGISSAGVAWWSGTCETCGTWVHRYDRFAGLTEERTVTAHAETIVSLREAQDEIAALQKQLATRAMSFR